MHFNVIYRKSIRCPTAYYYSTFFTRDETRADAEQHEYEAKQMLAKSYHCSTTVLTNRLHGWPTMSDPALSITATKFVNSLEIPVGAFQIQISRLCRHVTLYCNILRKESAALYCRLRDCLRVTLLGRHSIWALHGCCDNRKYLWYLLVQCSMSACNDCVRCSKTMIILETLKSP